MPTPTETNAAIQKHFDFANRMSHLPWSPKIGGREMLVSLFQVLEFREGAEVGTCRGHFACQLCNGNPQLHLTCIDHWAPFADAGPHKQERNYAETMKNVAGKNVTVHRKPSLLGSLDFADSSLDFVYIDADHLFDAVVQDIIAWVPKVKPGGIVACHDYHHEVGSGVVWAVDTYTHCHDIRPWYITREHWPSAFWVKQ